MYSVGEMVVYGRTGVCTVVNIGVPDIPGAQQLCYTLRPRHDASALVYTPVAGTRITMRPLHTRVEIRRLIAQLPLLPSFPYEKNKRERLEVYYKALQSADSCQLARLVKTLYEERLRLLGMGKPLPSAEKECLAQAMQILHGEVAVALDIPLEQVEPHIGACLEQGQEL